jgi:hypothetical protein
MNFYGAKFSLGFIHNFVYPLEKREVIFYMHRKKKGGEVNLGFFKTIYQS